MTQSNDESFPNQSDQTLSHHQPDQTIAHQAADIVDNVADNIKSAAHVIGDGVRSTAHNVRQTAGRAAGAVHEVYEEAGQYARQSFDRTRARARSIEHRLENTVRQNPKTSLLIAAALGAAIVACWKRR